VLLRRVLKAKPKDKFVCHFRIRRFPVNFNAPEPAGRQWLFPQLRRISPVGYRINSSGIIAAYPAWLASKGNFRLLFLPIAGILTDNHRKFVPHPLL
jgi:hypothetical protein